jgi:hypothetical protein
MEQIRCVCTKCFRTFRTSKTLEYRRISGVLVSWKTMAFVLWRRHCGSHWWGANQDNKKPNKTMKVADDIENFSIPQFHNSWFALMNYLLKMPLERFWAFAIFHAPHIAEEFGMARDRVPFHSFEQTWKEKNMVSRKTFYYYADFEQRT